MRPVVAPMIAIAFLLVFSGVLAAQGDAPNSGSWSGVIINNNCTADEAFAEAAKCTEKDVPGAKLVLYDDTTGRCTSSIRRNWPWVTSGTA